MTANGWFQICFFFPCARLRKASWVYMARVFERERTFADRLSGRSRG